MNHLRIEELIKKLETHRVFLPGIQNVRAKAFAYLAKESFDKDDFDLALNYYSLALDLEPRNSFLLNKRASCYRMLNDFDNSIRDATLSKNIEDNFENNQNLAICFLMKKQYSHAISHFESALQHLVEIEKLDRNQNSIINYASTKSRLLNNLAICFFNSGMLERGIDASTKGIKANSNYPNNYNVRGMLLFMLGNVDSAIMDITKAVELGDLDAKSTLMEMLEHKRKI